MGIPNLDNSLLLDFIKTIDNHLIEELFNSPFTCSVIFRELPSLSKHIISRILFIDETVRKSLIASWVNKDYNTMLNKSLKELSDLRIFTNVSNGPQGECMRLNRKFQENFKCSLFGGKPFDLVKEYLDDSFQPEAPSSLMAPAIAKWEMVLSLVAAIKPIRADGGITEAVVLNAGYVNEKGITNEGFQFLLLQKKKQVWQFLICYLKHMEKKTKIVDIFNVLFQIGYGSVNQLYTCVNPTMYQIEMLKHFFDFGFISIFKELNKQKCVFQPTKLLIDLLSGNDRLSSGDKIEQSQSIIAAQGYIIMESSDLIYATTDSELQAAVLGMFCKVIKSFKNGIIFHITDQSISRALEKGITSDQIIAFLGNNAHPQMKDKHIVPITLVDKIKMVEYNLNRTRKVPGFLYQHFNGPTEYDVLANFAESQNAVLWKSREKEMIIVSDESHSAIRRFWKGRRNADYI